MLPEEKLLPFISNEALLKHVGKVLSDVKNATNEADKQMYSNVIDPFSAVFDSLHQNITITEWLRQEKARQIQKTLQNSIGDFHQQILGSILGWESLPTGNVVDLRNKDKKIIAEVKNKFNTTKGNHKVDIYEDFETLLNGDYKEFTAYYVEIIPKNPKPYNKPFTPSDNRTHSRKPINEKIRVIDGQSFYQLATDDSESLKKLYEVLPSAIASILNIDVKTFTNDAYSELFNRAYKIIK